MNPYQIYKDLIHNPKTRWLIIILTVLYFFMPIDFIPEVFLGPFGLIDDGVILSILVMEIVAVLRKNKEDTKNNHGDVVEGGVEK